MMTMTVWIVIVIIITSIIVVLYNDPGMATIMRFENRNVEYELHSLSCIVNVPLSVGCGNSHDVLCVYKYSVKKNGPTSK